MGNNKLKKCTRTEAKKNDLDAAKRPELKLLKGDWVKRTEWKKR
jgi:hypothetical protein